MGLGARQFVPAIRLCSPSFPAVIIWCRVWTYLWAYMCFHNSIDKIKIKLKRVIDIQLEFRDYNLYKRLEKHNKL